LSSLSSAQSDRSRRKAQFRDSREARVLTGKTSV
jgi:hypothetical protein